MKNSIKRILKMNNIDILILMKSNFKPEINSNSSLLHPFCSSCLAGWEGKQVKQTKQTEKKKKEGRENKEIINYFITL